MRRLGAFPNFVVIGGQYCGTDQLRRALGHHPDVCVPQGEIEFFSRHYHRGPGWYRTWFDECDGQQAVGDVTPGYMRLVDDPALIAARIDGMLPDVRLIALLRDPVERAKAAYLHHVARDRIPPATSLQQYLLHTPAEKDPLGIISGGWYGRVLKPYVARFERRLLVVLYEDLVVGSTQTLRRLLDHLLIDSASSASQEFLSRTVDLFGSGDTAGPVSAEDTVAQTTTDGGLSLYELYRDDLAWLKSDCGVEISRWEPTAQRQA